MTPLLLFGYDRPHKLRQVVEAIKKQTIKPDLIIAFIDGQPTINDDITRACAREVSTIADEVIVRPHNFGCAANIMCGVKDAADRYERFLILEDDVLPAHHWYQAMRNLLDHYGDDDLVATVGSFPSILTGSMSHYHHDVILSPRFSCWGWGSWSKKWHFMYDEWDGYRSRNYLPWTPTALPVHGGSDIGQMIGHYHPGQLWDAIMAGSHLHHGKLQAITKHYMVNNIGVDKHLSQSKIEFMASHNLVREVVPSSFPPSVPDESVAAAVRDYVHVMSI